MSNSPDKRESTRQELLAMVTDIEDLIEGERETLLTAAALLESHSAPSSLARNEILEEAAKVCDDYFTRMGMVRGNIAPYLAERIRALKSATAPAATEKQQPVEWACEKFIRCKTWCGGKRCAARFDTPSAIACNELPKGFVSLDDYIAELEKDPAQKALLDNALAWVKANKESWIRDTPPTSGTRMSDVERALWLADKLVGDYGSEAAQLLRKFASSAIACKESPRWLVRAGGDCYETWLCPTREDVRHAFMEALYGDVKTAMEENTGSIAAHMSDFDKAMAEGEKDARWSYEDGWLEVVCLVDIRKAGE